MELEGANWSAVGFDGVNGTRLFAPELSKAKPQYKQMLRVGALAREQPGHEIISDAVNARRSFSAESLDGVSLSAVTALVANYTISIAVLIV